MKKIGVIGLKGLPAFGGAASVGENLINELKDKYEFTVYSVSSHTGKSGRQDGYYQHVFDKIPFRHFNIFVYYLKSAFHSLFMANYDLIHLHHIDGAFILPILRIKYKVILTIHARPQLAEKWSWYARFLFSFNEKLSFYFANSIICVSKILQEYYRNAGKKGIDHIPNGVKTNHTITENISENKPYILFAAGRIIPLKGLHILLEAFRKAGVKQTLRVIGDLDQMPEYKAKIIKLSSGLDIEFYGLIKNKELLFQSVKNCSFFVFPSYSENMSMILLEAASLKVPIICSDIPENKAIFNENEVLFFKTNDIDQLAAKLKFALTEKKQIIEYSERAYKKLIENYSLKNVAEQYNIKYQSLITVN